MLQEHLVIQAEVAFHPYELFGLKNSKIRLQSPVLCLFRLKIGDFWGLFVAHSGPDPENHVRPHELKSAF